MRAIEIDARRYAWCRGGALWIMGPPVAQWVEDMQGAAEAGQNGLARYCARQLGEACAVMLTLVLRNHKPIPPPHMRGSWALDHMRGHELWDECWELMRGAEDVEVAELVERVPRLVQRVREIVGEVPDPLTPEGYFPALALARDWLNLLDTVGEESFLPKEWIRR
jgi:hypothetical protein